MPSDQLSGLDYIRYKEVEDAPSKQLHVCLYTIIIILDYRNMQ